MDISKAKSIITPAGSLKRILNPAGVVIWEKPSEEPNYRVYKDGELVAKLTLSNFIDTVHSGAAQEDWGIGAELELPTGHRFYFGTFTKYGNGKLGLYAKLPAISNVPYGPTTGTDQSRNCAWSNSYAKKMKSITKSRNTRSLQSIN